MIHGCDSPSSETLLFPIKQLKFFIRADFYSYKPPNKSLHWTAQAGFLSKGCCRQSGSKLRVTMLAKLVYNQTSVCTPVWLFGEVSVEQPVNSSVGLLEKRQKIYSKRQFCGKTTSLFRVSWKVLLNCKTAILWQNDLAF